MGWSFCLYNKQMMINGFHNSFSNAGGKHCVRDTSSRKGPSTRIDESYTYLPHHYHDYLHIYYVYVSILMEGPFLLESITYSQ